MIDKFAPILPFEGLGGIKLGNTKRDVEAMCERSLGEAMMLFDGKWSRYQMGDLIMLFFEEKGGTLIKITALPQYRGTLFGKIGTGFPIRELMAMDHTFQYDEFEEICYSDERGVEIDAPSLDGNAEWISVYREGLEAT